MKLSQSVLESGGRFALVQAILGLNLKLKFCSHNVSVVTVASSGLEALDVLRKHAQGTFHLILTVRLAAVSV